MSLRSNLRPAAAPGKKIPVPPKDGSPNGKSTGGDNSTVENNNNTSGDKKKKAYADMFPTCTARSLEPKVLVPFEHHRGRVPRKIEVERRRRQYESQDAGNLLSLAELKLEKSNQQLPIEIFDDTSFECRNPDEWMSIAREAETAESRFLPAQAVRYNTDTQYELQYCRVTDWKPDINQVKVYWGTGAETAQGQQISDEQGDWMPRIFVHLLAEDPVVFVQRLQNAQQQRVQATNWIKYRLCCDAMPTEGLPPIDPRVMERITKVGSGIPQLAPEKFPQVEERCKNLMEELTLEWRRTHNRIMLERRLESDVELQTTVEKSTHLSTEQILQGNDATGTTASTSIQPVPEDPDYSYAERNESFTFCSYYTQPEVVHALTAVREQCMAVLERSLFSLPKARQMSLQDFEKMQYDAMDSMTTYLKENWKDDVCRLIGECFGSVGKGWLNVREANQEIYEVSKLKKFFTTVKYLMEDTLFELVYRSLTEFTEFFEEVSEFTVDVKDMNTVRNSWKGSDAPDAVEKQPLFTLELVERDGAFSYSTSLNRFEEIIVALFDRAIDITKAIPQVEKFVMNQYFWATDGGQGPYLDTVKKEEERVCALRDRVRNVLHDSLRPLDQYIETYNELLDIAKLDKDQYIADFASEEHTTEEMKEEIRKHHKAKKATPARIPFHITVGNFVIDCHHFKQHIAAKIQELAKMVMDLICKMAKQKTGSILDDFKKIVATIQKPTKGIEHVTEIRTFIASLPEQLAELKVRIEEMRTFYNILELFQYGLSNVEFEHKWEAIGWPRKLDNILDLKNKELEKDTEHWHEVMVTEQEAHGKEVDRLQRIVAIFTKYTDSEQHAEVAAQVKTLNRQIKDCVDKSRDFNSKQRLFGDDLTDYHGVLELDKEFKPYRDLWMTTHTWKESYHKWYTDPFESLDPEELDSTVTSSAKTMGQLAKTFKDKPAMLKIVEEIRKGVEEFRPLVPIVKSLRNPGMKDRHWEGLSEKLEKPISPGENLNTMKDCEELREHRDLIVSHCEVAAREYQIEKALKDMRGKWAQKNFIIEAYRNTKTFVVKETAEIQELLDEHLNITQQLQFSHFKAFFAEEIDTWEKDLNLISEILEQWLECQRSWRYLEPIFSSEDIAMQLPKHHKTFEKVDRTWRKLMGMASQNPNALHFTQGNKVLEQFTDCNRMLESVQKGLNDYLAEKRQAFPRFYFLSDEELLEILSTSKDPRNIDKNLKKLFEFIARMEWADNNDMLGFYSSEKEYIPHTKPLPPAGQVESWLGDVQTMMKDSVHAQMKLAYEDYTQTPRKEWVLKWPGQIVMAGAQIFWTAEAEDHLERNKSVKEYKKQLDEQLMDLVDVVQSPDLRPIEHINMGALITIEVHAKDTIENMVKDGVSDAKAFDWIKQLRFYFEEDNFCHLRQVDAHFIYGGEYLGNTGRLVVTPLTDRIYLTLTGALSLCLGGAPAGPAGTGKTETTKDLAKALAKQCVVFNCQEGMTYQSMGKFFKGLAWTGAWACFDEFNRIDVEVLSVVAQQVTDLQQACLTTNYRLDNFEGSEVVVDPTYAVFITMNPGYAGRTELPDNLKVLFRPVACMVPDYALIGEIRLFSYGYKNARKLAQKMVATFRLSSEQLSSQDHYDFGMRAVNTVISAAGLNKRKNPEMEEDLLLLRALSDSNVPKFLREDIGLFNGIIKDLFPGVDLPDSTEQLMVNALGHILEERNQQQIPDFVLKAMQLYDVTVLRHGLMLVGPTGSGKTTCMKTLQGAMTWIATKQAKGSIAGPLMQKVYTHICNPKAITMDQLYGAYDKNTGEWNDGILCILFRRAAYAEDGGKQWVVFDGPVDALWIESMNTVLDENKKLCLVSGEIIQMSKEMTMMFEVEDLAVASPATVSRCGMIYLEPESCVPTWARIKSWVGTLPVWYAEMGEELSALATNYLDPLVTFVRRNLKEYVPTVDNNLVHSCFNMMNAYIQSFSVPPQPAGNPPISAERLEIVKKCNKSLFLHSVVWSVGASCDAAGREEFDAKFREMLQANGDEEAYAAEGSVYDWSFKYNADPEQEVEPTWERWEETQPPFALKQQLPYFQVNVPTIDTIRQDAIMFHLVNRLNNIAAVGPTGTGKSISVSRMIMGGLPEKFQGLAFTFSAQTSANVLQDSLMSKLDKRRKDVFGAPTGKHFVCFIDDTNLPQREKYFAQPPIELLRQFLGHGGFYTYSGHIKFQNIIDVSLCLAMGPPGGGRNPITPRFLRYFNYVAFPELGNESMAKIFSSILKGGFNLGRFPQEIVDCVDPMVACTLNVFKKCQKVFVPTPAHVHYTFNLRDVSRVFALMYDADLKVLRTKDNIVKLWVHEMERVFQDRLISPEDIAVFADFMNQELIESFDYEKGREQLVQAPRLVYGDYMVPGADKRVYDEVSDINVLVTRMNEYLTTYNEEDDHMEMNLVLFLDAIEHVSRIARVLRMPGGHCLLLGIGGSGRKSLTRLACAMQDRMELFTVEITKNFGPKEWKESISKMILECGKDDKKTCFLYSDTQILKPVYLEEVASLLTSGDIPNLFDEKQMDVINDQFRSVCLSEGLPTTKISMYTRFIKEVKNNLHVVLAFSPIGEVFRTRMRMFPALVNCCTIDWFAEWPREALFSVVTSEMEASAQVDFPEEMQQKIANVFCGLHLSASEGIEKFFVETKRRSYVTPTSFLSLLETFQAILNQKRQFVVGQRMRLSNGLDKLKETEERVAELEESLKSKAPILEQTQVEIKDMMARLAVDKEIAAEKQADARKEEAEASKQADACSKMQKKCADRLAEAEPALKEAVKVLRTIKVKDLGELGNYPKPPAGVKYCCEAVCIMLEFGVCPKDCIVGPPGQKEANWWLVAKQKLKDPKGLLELLVEGFDKEKMNDDLMAKMKPYIDNPEFVPQKVKEQSLACMALCSWVHAMYTWFYVNKEVIPLRAELVTAEAELSVVTAALNTTRAKLKEVEDKVAALEAEYDGAIAKQTSLQNELDMTQQKLNRAGRLIDGLGGEKQRWKELLVKYSNDENNVVGDALLAAGAVAYFGPLTMSYRHDLLAHWVTIVDGLGITHSEHIDLNSVVGNPVEIQQWQINGLPSDALSTENGLIMFKSNRWPLLIDPQGQANAWLRNMFKEDLQVCRASEPSYIKTIEVAIRMGKACLLENVGENLDPILDPVLLKATYNIGSTPHLRIGDSAIPYDPNFKFFMTTKLPNPIYTPESIVKVSLLNFFITPKGLEDQLLAKTVELERKDLEEQKKALTRNSAEKNKELKDLQDQILVMMQEAEGDILEQEVLITTLEMSKKKSIEINEDLQKAAETEKIIDETRNLYRPHAFRGSILFFTVASIASIDPMYQFSLQWFLNLFVGGIEKAEKSEDVNERIGFLKEYFTYSFYANVCRSLFEKHKLMFSFHLCTSIIRDESEIDETEFRFLMTGATSSIQGSENPAPDWMTEQTWIEMQFASKYLPNFAGFDNHVRSNLDHYKQLFDSNEAHSFPLAGEWADRATPMQKLIITRFFRLDKLSQGIQDFVKHYMEERYIIVPQFNLMDAYKDSDACTPLIFIISPGSDPMSDLLKFAEQMRMSKKLDKVSLGQGQGPKAAELVRDGVERGTWVLLQNCHLATSWMSDLEQLVESFSPETTKKEFRLWLTSMPSRTFPVAVLQIGVKMTNEPPKGLRANLTRSYFGLKEDDLNHKKKPEIFKYLLFAECLFHGVLQERRRFGSLGFNIAYEFNDSDRNVCLNQLRKFLEMYEDVPFDVLKFLTGHINYGGRVTDDWDRRCMMTMIEVFLSPAALEIGYKFSPSGLYKTIEGGNRAYYLDQLSSWPLNASPEVFGLHDNADITSARNETLNLLKTVLSTQAGGSGGGGSSRDDLLKETSRVIQEKLPKPFDMVAFQEKYPNDYNQSMNTVLVQEATRYNKLLKNMAFVLKEFGKALKGETVMSSELETLGNALFVNQVPDTWLKYPSLMPLSSWVDDLVKRCTFIQDWFENGAPTAFWMGGFFFPQAFLTGTLQNYARKVKEAIDTISFGFNILDTKPKDIKEHPESGAVIYGLILEGARWDPEAKSLVESRPKELFTDFPAIHLVPTVNRKIPENIYKSPVYKTLTRAGTLSTTGHSTNFVLPIEIPTNVPPEHWIKRGVACVLGLNF